MYLSFGNTLDLATNTTKAFEISSTQNSTFFGTVTGQSFIPTSTTVPSNGMYLSASNTLDLATNAAKALEIGSDGGVTLGAPTGGDEGANTFNSAGAIFQNGLATTGAKTSWTPVLNFGGTTTGITYGTQAGKYVQNGKVVVAEFFLVLTSKGSATGTATITGLPVTANNAGNCSITYLGNMSSLGSWLYGAVSSTTIALQQLSLGSQAGLDNTNFTDTTQIEGTCTYIAS
jgi:hypothetical protein